MEKAMRLLESMMTKACLLIKTTERDSGGNFISSYEESDAFGAAFWLKSSSTVSAANAGVSVGKYVITVPEGVSLKYGDIVLRKSDGRKFTVTGESTELPPNTASIRFRQYTANEWIES